jgi:hypothetical protein
MRYLLANYYLKPTGQMDEVMSVARRVRTRDLQTASVILDFKTRSVVKCSLGDQIGTREFHTVRDYYYRHYKQIIQDLEKAHHEAKDHTG